MALTVKCSGKHWKSLHAPLLNQRNDKKKTAPFAVLLGVILLLTTKHIGDESYVSQNGDMPRYLMNGVFLKDALRDLPLQNPIEYSQDYFIQYPALSLGFHPPFLALADEPSTDH